MVDFLSKITKQRTTSDYQFIADSYRSRVERIKETSPNKFKP